MRLVHHTWQWLASRLPARAIWKDDHRATARECLAAVEPLGDRIMLDATLLPEGQIKGEADAQILIGLLKGQLELVKTQLEGLGIASKIGGEKLLHKLMHEWGDVNDVLSKFGEALIKGIAGESTDAKHKTEFYSYKLQSELADLNKITSKLDAQAVGLLLPAVQKVSDAAVDMFHKLGQLPQVEDLKWQDEHVLIKVSEVFGKMDDLLLKVAVDVLTGGFLKQDQAQIKFESMVNKASDYLHKLGNDELHKLLLPAVQNLAGDFEKILIGLTPIPDFSENPFTGGVSVTERTDDLISEA